MVLFPHGFVLYGKRKYLFSPSSREENRRRGGKKERKRGEGSGYPYSFKEEKTGKGKGNVSLFCALSNDGGGEGESKKGKKEEWEGWRRPLPPLSSSRVRSPERKGKKKNLKGGGGKKKGSQCVLPLIFLFLGSFGGREKREKKLAKGEKGEERSAPAAPLSFYHAFVDDDRKGEGISTTRGGREENRRSRRRLSLFTCHRGEGEKGEKGTS